MNLRDKISNMYSSERRQDMGIIYKSEQLNLPEEIARRLKGKEIELVETKEGILIKLSEDSIKTARGCLKGFGLTSEAYMKQKIDEKNLER